MKEAESTVPDTAAGQAPALAASRLAQAFSSLAVINFRYLLGGTVASSFAMWMEQIGQGWLVAQLTNSPFQLGLVQFIRGISILFVSPFAGGFSERVDRRLLAGAASMVNGLGALAIGVLILTGHIAMWQLYITPSPAASPAASTPGAPVPRVRRRRNEAATKRHRPQRDGEQHGAGSGAGDRRFHDRLQSFLGVLRRISVLRGSHASLAQFRLSQAASYEREPVLTSVRLGAGYCFATGAAAPDPVAAIPSMLIYPYLQLMPLMAKTTCTLAPQGTAGFKRASA